MKKDETYLFIPESDQLKCAFGCLKLKNIVVSSEVKAMLDLLDTQLLNEAPIAKDAVAALASLVAAQDTKIRLLSGTVRKLVGPTPAEWLEGVDEAAAYVRGKFAGIPQTLIIVGSGLGEIVPELTNGVDFYLSELPHYPESSVKIEGHDGKLMLGYIDGECVAVMKGRTHGYMGFENRDLAFQTYLGAALGARVVISTSAVGYTDPAPDTKFKPRDIMMVTDVAYHGPLDPFYGFPGKDPRFGPMFPPVSNTLDPALLAIAKDVFAQTGIGIHEGVYLPSYGFPYETKAQVKMYREWGADVLGMGLVPEFIAAARSGLLMISIAGITNPGTGVGGHEPNHKEVVENGEYIGRQLKGSMPELLRRIGLHFQNISAQT